MKLLLLLAQTILCITLFTQNITVEFKLSSRSGVPHKGIDLIVKGKEKTYKSKSNREGIALIEFEKGGKYTVKLSNSSKIRPLNLPNFPGSKTKMTYQYKHNQEDWSKKFPPSTEQRSKWLSKLKSLPDTTYSKLKVEPSKYENRTVYFNLKIENLKKGPLVNEKVFLKSRKFNKVIVAKTNKIGEAHILLPKGTNYDLSFKHDKNYELIETNMTLATSRKGLELMYPGTREIERLAKEKKEREKREAKRIKEERLAYKKALKARGTRMIDDKVSRLKKVKSKKNILEGNIINKVFSRNNWADKLIVTDVTGSMNPYMDQLIQWYALNSINEKNAAFVFFNDGDNLPDNKKLIGKTGGIYSSTNNHIDSVISLIALASSNGYGGDAPENNIEAILEAVKGPNFKELIMIADNGASVKDMELLNKVKVPVRVILCGSRGRIEEDYLEIVYKTKGSLHTIEKDLDNLWKKSEGEKVKVFGQEYVILKGKFRPIDKG